MDKYDGKNEHKNAAEINEESHKMAPNFTYQRMRKGLTKIFYLNKDLLVL